MNEKNLMMIVTLYRAYVIYKKYRGYYDCVQTGVTLLSGTYKFVKSFKTVEEKKMSDQEIIDSYILLENEEPDG